MEISLEGRYSKERDFHNKSFSEGTRGGADRFYEIINCSRAFYEGFLAANCLNKSVLEYGCGPGSYAFFLAQRGATVTGIDISDIAIDQAREDAKRKLLDKIDFRVM